MILFVTLKHLQLSSWFYSASKNSISVNGWYSLLWWQREEPHYVHWLTAKVEDERACGPVSKRENSVASWNELKNSKVFKILWLWVICWYGSIPLVKSPWYVCIYCECNTRNCFILSKSSVWGPALECGVPHHCRTECDEEHLPWLSLGWAQVREVLCLLLRFSRASGAGCCAAAAMLF